MKRINLDRSWECLESPVSLINVLGLMKSDFNWKPVNLPHDVAIEKERDKDNPSGSGEGYTAGSSLFYKKELFLDEKWRGKNLILEFEGIMWIAEVFVNGRLVAKHFNGYTSFLVDITKHVNFDDKNTIFVHVENTHKPNSRWYAGTGIYRHVWLYVGNKVYIKPWQLHVETKAIDDGTAILEIRSAVANSSSETASRVMRFQIFSASGELLLSNKQGFDIGRNEGKEIIKTLELKPFRYWDIEDPYLYEIQADIIRDEDVEDSASTMFGIRTISVSPKEGLKLNGKSIKLKGGCTHHDNGPLGSASYDRAEERKIELLKASGFNAVRLTHNPFSPGFLDACDRLGMLVIEEFFDVWTGGKVSFDYHLFFDKYWEEDIENTIKRDYNHPSLIMRSIGNEITWGAGIDVNDKDGYSNIYSWCRRLSLKVKAMDSTRLVTSAFCAIPSELIDRTSIEDGNIVVTMLPPEEVDPANDKWGEVTEIFFEPLDVAGYNYKVGRYSYDSVRFPNRIICGTETHPYTLFKNWTETVKNPNVIGDFVWTAIDYLGEAGIGMFWLDENEMRMFGGEFPWLLANCGDIDICGEKRPQSFYRDIIWGNRRDPYIAILPPNLYGKKLYIRAWGWEPVERSYTFPGCEGMPITVYVYADADEVELFINGRSLGRKTSGFNTQFKTTYDATYEPGVIEVVAYKNGIEIGRDRMESASEPVSIKLLPDRDIISSSYNDLCYIKIIAVDKNGKESPYADNRITVEVDGAGEFVVLGTADPLSTELFVNRERKLYKGKALAIVKSIGEKGEISFKAKGEGLEGAQIAIKCI